MKNKYFIPQVEDLRINYVCEVEMDRLLYKHSGDWRKTIIKINSSDYDIQHAIGDVATMNIRVPFLTIKQIEKEGWKLEWNDGDDGIETFNFKKESWILDISFGFKDVSNHVLIGKSANAIYFRGEIKSINELRYICKLLKI